MLKLRSISKHLTIVEPGTKFITPMQTLDLVYYGTDFAIEAGKYQPLESTTEQQGKN